MSMAPTEKFDDCAIFLLLKRVLNSYAIDKRKPGPKPKLTEREKSWLRSEAARIHEKGKRVTSGKLSKCPNVS